MFLEGDRAIDLRLARHARESKRDQPRDDTREHAAHQQLADHDGLLVSGRESRAGGARRARTHARTYRARATSRLPPRRQSTAPATPAGRRTRATAIARAMEWA